MYLANHTSRRINELSSPLHLSNSEWRMHNELVERAVERLQSYVEGPSDPKREELRESLRELESANDEYESIEETLTDFLAKNREHHPIEPDLNPGGRLVCVGDEEFEHIFRDGDGWARFRKEFPDSDGTLRLSRVGFDRDVTQAMLYAGQQFDWNVGSGGFWLFSCLDGEWTEVGRAGSWLS